MLLPLCPQCDCLACILFQHPQQHSLRLQGLGSWCKVNHTEEGKMARESERAHGTVCFLSPFRTRGSNISWLQEEEVCVFNISASPSAHGHVLTAYALTAQTVSDMKSKPAHLLLSIGYESRNKSVLKESKTLLKYTLHLHRKHKLCITASDSHGELWWMVMDDAYIL